MPWFTKQRKKKAKNIKKKRKHKRSKKIFRIKLRNDRFRLFGPHSKPISVVPAWFKADFGRFSRQPKQLDSANTAWFWPNQPGSAQIEAKLAQIEPSQRKSMKKKKLRRGTDVQAAASDATPRIGLQWGTLPIVSMLHSLPY